MAYIDLNHSMIILLLYINIFNPANPIKANDSWLWPNELDTKIDERPFIPAENLISSSSINIELSMRQKRPGIIYQDNPLLATTAVQRNSSSSSSSAWKRLKTNTASNLTLDLIKPTGSTSLEISKNLHSKKDWSFPEENLVKRKAELKCAEYNKAVENKDVWIHPLVSNWPIIPLTRQSGQTKCKGLKNPLIIGGIVAQRGEFPHMAALGWLSSDNEASFLCGGSLISNSWVITAAHCTHGPSGPPKVVRIGANRLGDKTTGKLIRVETIIRHPLYKPPAVYADLALLKLDKTVHFGSDIKPACLYTEFDTTPIEAWATGWGVTGLGEDQSDELLKIRLDVIDNVACALKLNRSIAIPRGIVPSMLCAGDIGGDWHSDTCQGDSGGPLQVLHPNHKCLHQIIGITSFGRLCALKNSPGVYTRISHYLDWIERIVWPDYNRYK